MANQNDIFTAITNERAYQDGKWGNNPHTVAEWLLIVEKELEEAKDAWVKKGGDEAALEELLQVVSVGVACMEQHGIVERYQPRRKRRSVKRKEKTMFNKETIIQDAGHDGLVELFQTNIDKGEYNEIILDEDDIAELIRVRFDLDKFTFDDLLDAIEPFAPKDDDEAA